MLPRLSSAVPVFPATLRLDGNPTPAAVPPWTTSCIIWVSSAAVFALMGRCQVLGEVALTSEPSGAVIFWTRYGVGSLPWFAMVEATSAICSGVTSILYWPNARRPTSTFARFFGDQRLPLL